MRLNEGERMSESMCKQCGFDSEVWMAATEEKLTKLTEDNRVLREALENADRLITDGWSVKGRDLIREALAKTAREGEK